jgi:thiamine pyrophosphokinase
VVFVFFSSSPDTENELRALIFANGDLNDGPAVQAALRTVPDALIIAADGGAQLAAACGLVPDVVVGDMDSLTSTELEDLRARGVLIQRYPANKDETDLELALLAAVARQATWIRVIGALGDRIDQTLANIYLLTLRNLAGRDVRLVAGRQTLWLIGPGKHTLTGAPGDTISLLPLLPGVTGVTTERLQYPLQNATLSFGPSRGVSNVMLADEACISLMAGTLIVIHSPGRA